MYSDINGSRQQADHELSAAGCSSSNARDNRECYNRGSNRLRHWSVIRLIYGIPLFASFYRLSHEEKRDMMRTFTTLIASAAFAVSGCATITRGSEDVLVVNSEPQGAQVQLSNGMSCTSTPCSFTLPRRSNIGVTVSRRGCQSVTTNVTHRTADAGAAGIAGNVLVGGLIGLGVDAATGASQDLVPNPVNVNLRC